MPVLAKECIEMLRIRPDGIYADGTLGGGGHSSLILEALNDKGRLFGFDRDEEAIAAARLRLKGFEDRMTVIHSNFGQMADRLHEKGIMQVDGILLDLGVSSHQLDDRERGFTYRCEAPLDMRMDRGDERTAADVVNTYAYEQLLTVIRDYGEERYAARIAGAIVRTRETKPIETTTELAEIVRNAIPVKARSEKGHPAKRTFQAIRIEVNAELEVLEKSLDGMIDLLTDGGRICVITFHSLEDRIVKNVFRRNENPCTCPPGFPVCVCGKVSKGKVLTRRAIVPKEDEIQRNARSHSAKLRVFERRSDDKRSSEDA